MVSQAELVEMLSQQPVYTCTLGAFQGYAHQRCRSRNLDVGGRTLGLLPASDWCRLAVASVRGWARGSDDATGRLLVGETGPECRPLPLCVHAPCGFDLVTLFPEACGDDVDDSHEGWLAAVERDLVSLAACPAVAHCVGLARVLASAIGRKTRNDVEGRLGSSAGSAASVGSLPALPGESVVRDAAAGHAVVVASGIPVVTLSQLLDELFLFSFKLAADSSQEGPDGKLSQASQDSTSCQDCIVVHRVDEQPAGMTLQHVVGRFGLSSHGTMSSAVLASVFCVCGPPQPSAVTAAVLKNWLTEAMVRANAGTSMLDVSPCMHPSSQALGPCTVHMPDPVGHRWLVGVCHCLVSTAPRAPPPAFLCLTLPGSSARDVASSCLQGPSTIHLFEARVGSCSARQSATPLVGICADTPGKGIQRMVAGF